MLQFYDNKKKESFCKTENIVPWEKFSFMSTQYIERFVQSQLCAKIQTWKFHQHANI